MNFGKIASAIFLFAILLLTVGLFFLLGFYVRPVQWVSLFFLLLSEGIVFGGGFYLKHIRSQMSAIIFSVSQIFLFSLYFLITLSLFFITLLFSSVLLGILLHSINLLLFAGLFFLVMAIAHRTAKSDQRLAQARVVMDECQKRVEVLLGQLEATSPYYRELNAIMDLFRYADKMSRESKLDLKVLDNTMRVEEALLGEEQSDVTIKEALRSLKLALEQRKISLASSKRGGF